MDYEFLAEISQQNSILGINHIKRHQNEDITGSKYHKTFGVTLVSSPLFTILMKNSVFQWRF